MTEELKVKVILDTSDLKNGVKEIKKILSDTSSGLGGINKTTQSATQSTKGVTAAMATMGATTVAQTAIMAKAIAKLNKTMAPTKSYIDLLKDDFKGLFSALGKNFDPAGDKKIKAWLDTLKTSLKEVGATGKTIGKQIIQHFGGAFKTAALVAVKGVSAIVGAISALLFAMTRLSASTKEFRQAMNQVNTSFIALGSDAKTAAASYGAFYRILGDVQRSTEAANLLAQITTEEKNLVTWTKIATGALAMFPDSLPTESLIEASNETIKTAKVTGVLADALNWPADAASKISEALEGSAEAQSIFNKNISKGMTVEDAFNEVLKETNNETQREAILRASLNGIYAQSAGLYEEMNKELIKQNEAQNRLNQAMAKLGSITQPVQTAFANFRATLAKSLAPAIKVVCDWLVKLIEWLTTAAAWLGAFLAVIFPSAAEKIKNAFNGVSTSIDTAVGGTGGLNEGLQESEKTAQKLRRTLMGFDELNVVSSPSSSSTDTSGSSGGISAGGGIDVSGLDAEDSIFKKAQDQMDGMKEKVQEVINKIKGFIDEFKTELIIIGAALATLEIVKLISSLLNAIGLGERFLGIMGTIKKLAVSAITIVLQYTLVNEFMDKYIDGEGFKNYILGLLTAAVGTGILYAMWGPAGAVIGLGVTAVASLQAIFDNGGVTNTESFVVLLTSIATAMGAIGIAWKGLGLKNIVTGFGTFFAMLQSGQGFITSLTTAFPKLATVITKIGLTVSSVATIVKNVVRGIGTFLSTTWGTISTLITKGLAAARSAIRIALGAIKTAVATVIQFIIANPIALIIAAIAALVILIATKGDEIQNALNKLSKWISGIFARDWREVFGNTLGTIMNGFVHIVGDVLTGVKEVLNGIINFIRGIFTGDWQRAWDGVKEIFSGVFDALAAIAKAPLNAVITLINGLLSAITSGLNAVKRALNKISIDIPDWVPILGGKTFGFNFSMSTAPQIPLLAEGGIAYGSTLANIGENGREAVLPLDRNTEWMDQLADRIAARNQAPTKIVLKVGERELGWATINGINQITKQTGGLQLQLV